eukprot:m.58549 g.58549  ORF g.58549 m.58549 type:complete len:51 (+) comp49168_c0_seq4:796-948(+)
MKNDADGKHSIGQTADRMRPSSAALDVSVYGEPSSSAIPAEVEAGQEPRK